jgi:hypothetical protein
MATYRFIWLDEKRNFVKSEHIECATDEQAIEIAAHQTGDYKEIEVWDGPRPVCRCGNPNKISKG